MANVFVVDGNLGKDPEIKQINGKTVAVFSVANSAGYGDKKRTNWFNVECWNEKQAENVGRYLRKGSKVLITGEIRIRSFTGQDGNTRTATEIYASSVDFLDTKAAAANGTADSEDLPF
jgi:single-strand DNA-binding protein